MRELGYDPAPLVLGLVLGPVMERSLLQALTIARGDPGGLWGSPLSAGLLLAAIAVLIAPALARLGARLQAATTADRQAD
jgi:TctA family transporter